MYAKDLHVVVQRLRKVFKFTIRQISNLLNVSKTTVHRWLCSPDQKQQTKQTIRTKKIDIDLNTVFKQNPFQTLKDLIIDHELDVSISTLSRRFKDLGISKKKVYPIGIPNMERIVECRRAFSDLVRNIPVDDIISLDETSFYTQMNPHYGWSPKGTRLTCPIQRKQSGRYSVTSAICSTGLLHQTVVSGSSNEKQFIQFLEGLKGVPQRYIMLDNVAFHKTRDVRVTFQKIGKTPLFISPYSPEWNPVEFYFSMMKSHLRKYKASKKDSLLDEFGKQCCNRRDTFSNIFQHSFKMIKACFHR